MKKVQTIPKIGVSFNLEQMKLNEVVSNDNNPPTFRGSDTQINDGSTAQSSNNDKLPKLRQRKVHTLLYNAESARLPEQPATPFLSKDAD